MQVSPVVLSSGCRKFLFCTADAVLYAVAGMTMEAACSSRASWLIASVLMLVSEEVSA